MSSSSPTLIYVARIRKSEKEAIFALDTAFPNCYLKTTFLDTVNDVCVDRLIRASNCLDVAHKMAVGTEEEELRTTVGRGYYSIHHSIRALALHHNKWDPDGHEESIQEFKRLLGDKPFRDNAGLPEDAWKSIVEA